MTGMVEVPLTETDQQIIASIASRMCDEAYQRILHRGTLSNQELTAKVLEIYATGLIQAFALGASRAHSGSKSIRLGEINITNNQKEEPNVQTDDSTDKSIDTDTR